MIDKVLNLLFRCSHGRLTRPFAPVTRAGQPHSQSYVVCLDCGKHFEYDVTEMRIGKVIDASSDSKVALPGVPKPRKRNLKYALAACLSAAAVLVAVLTGRKKAANVDNGKADPPAH